jgi:UPF0755 protein
MTGDDAGETATVADQEKAAPSKGRRLLLWVLLSALGLALLGAAGVGGLYLYGKHRYEAEGPLEAPEIVFLKRGMGLNTIARVLEEEGAVESALIFRLGVRLAGLSAALKAGEYEIPAHASMQEIAALLHEGKAILHKVTVPEGRTSHEIVEIVKADPVLVGEVSKVPEEGALLPETYLFERGTSRDEILARMAAAHDAVMEELWPARAENLPIKTEEEAVILASIVEKETGVAEERPRVASVFINRLNRGMRLQSDPTIIYGITGGKGPLGRRIRRSEIDGATPYNTYQIDGLPPTPIANPGRAAIEAVLNPPETKDLYFVADGTGGHAFASSLKEHLKNVAAFRRIQRERGER